MPKIFLFFSLLLFSQLSLAQSLSPEIISSSGANFNSGGSSLSWTIGEPIIDTYNAGSSQLTQGFHQSYLNITAIQPQAIGLEIRAYPNPSQSTVFIEIGGNPESYQLELFNILGQRLQSFEAENSNAISIDLSAYAAGNYLLRISQQNATPIQTFKMQKIK